jgi:protoheme IX farnesyltransferase
MRFRDDYAAASVPMLPVVAPAAVVARKIVIYSWAMVAATLALAPYAGWIYGACAAGLGGWFLVEAHRLRGQIAAVDSAPPGAAGQPAPAPMRLFHLSIAYLTLLFAVVAVTSLLPWGRW